MELQVLDELEFQQYGAAVQAIDDRLPSVREAMGNYIKTFDRESSLFEGPFHSQSFDIYRNCSFVFTDLVRGETGAEPTEWQENAKKACRSLGNEIAAFFEKCDSEIRHLNMLKETMSLANEPS